ncbi:leucine-rich repeat receptor protein kinase HPCA1 isoform X3 [Rosa chinensis]|uniref:leucine-rich repeat receptor protein kinase HPCA1 isoform X3 n=1 Tax=Rosa chinensis TaxID=74649 RepID=UPI000D087CDD|nr:leucine-rich repeat receptor protein kinase HPCA1 isoform X3 [Rosa chinensis]XP_024157214.1 leucine-rich repeat receptor protein kinase HPCA1 isoform X3 [Rosa chinensis]XP_040375694.1 leucine-rich repeat receptor protein kinase HPCA1 isoform X3 [Rosa chinensis]
MICNGSRCFVIPYSTTEIETSRDLSYNKGLTGPLPAEIGSLKKLSNIIPVGCSFSGLIPPTVGSLQELVYMSLNSGRIPSSIGSLSRLYWLDLADNNLEGPIPVSDSGEPGLDILSHCKHFHLGMNKLSGTIPSKLLSSNMSLIHVLFESNQLIGSILSSLGLVKSLEVVQFDRNMLTGPIPLSLYSLTNVSQLWL